MKSEVKVIQSKYSLWDKKETILLDENIGKTFYVSQYFHQPSKVNPTTHLKPTECTLKGIGKCGVRYSSNSDKLLGMYELVSTKTNKKIPFGNIGMFDTLEESQSYYSYKYDEAKRKFKEYITSERKRLNSSLQNMENVINKFDKDYKETKFKQSDLVVGEVYITKDNSWFVYMGKIDIKDESPNIKHIGIKDRNMDLKSVYGYIWLYDSKDKYDFVVGNHEQGDRAVSYRVDGYYGKELNNQEEYISMIYTQKRPKVFYKKAGRTISLEKEYLYVSKDNKLTIKLLDK